MTSRVARSVAVLAVLVAGSVLGLPAPVHASGGTYVALGDSYAAGPIIPIQEKPWGCLKSTNNYAHLVANRLGLDLRDATCSGAETGDMTGTQGVWPKPNPPQFDRLDASVGLVTVQIGGNDIGFSDIAKTCAQAGVDGDTCESHYVVNGDDQLRDRIAATAPKVAAVIQGIHTLSPSAKVLVLGYPGIFKIGSTPDAPAGCPAMLVGESDAKYLRGVEEALDAMIAEQAAANDAHYVDVYGPSAGKTACDLPVLRWIEPIVPVNAAAPVHPNLEGMIGVAQLVEQAAAQP